MRKVNGSLIEGSKVIEKNVRRWERISRTGPALKRKQTPTCGPAAALAKSKESGRASERPCSKYHRLARAYRHTPQRSGHLLRHGLAFATGLVQRNGVVHGISDEQSESEGESEWQKTGASNVGFLRLGH